jgi:hypothetical protein
MAKRIKISSFLQDDKNFNKHTEFGMGLLEKSLRTVGVIESITVSSDDKIISGNARQEKIADVFGDEVEPIIVETDGTRPVVLKRTDIDSNSKKFYEAAILANTVSKKNINFDSQTIKQVAVDEYNIDVSKLGVDTAGTVLGKSFENKNDEYIEQCEFPITIIATRDEYDMFQVIRQKLGGCSQIKTFSEIIKKIYDNRIFG